MATKLMSEITETENWATGKLGNEKWAGRKKSNIK